VSVALVAVAATPLPGTGRPAVRGRHVYDEGRQRAASEQTRRGS
jgi:hypothetical protein